MNDVLKPAALRPGDTVAVVAPAGPVDPTRLEQGVARLRSWGLDVELMPHLFERTGYLAGDDAGRLEDLTAAFTDPGIAGVICARGGYGSTRIVDGLDFDALASQPKVFVGTSDIDAMHLALWKRCRLVTFHGPGPADPTGAFDSEATRRSLRETVMADEDFPRTVGSNGNALTSFGNGTARGRIIGGNLTMLCTTLGTPDEVKTEGAILLFEDHKEPAFKVDRMLTQIDRAGKLRSAAGVVVGEFTAPGRPTNAPDVLTVLEERLGRLGIPVVVGVAVGHGPVQETIPLGVTVEVDADAGTVTVLEKPTS